MLAGPDVSYAQGTIDWSTVRMPAGHELAFGICRATYGTSIKDWTFHHNWHGIRARGLIRGAYHYATPHPAGGVRAAATAEAEYYLAMLHSVGGVHEGDLPPILDLEQSTGLSSEQLYEWIGAWVRAVERSTGRTPMIYCGGYWKSVLNEYTEAFGCPLWLAQYGPSPQLPRAWRRWTLWQYTDAQRFAGIGSCDASVFNGSRAELEHLAGHARPAHAPAHRPPPHHNGAHHNGAHPAGAHPSHPAAAHAHPAPPPPPPPAPAPPPPPPPAAPAPPWGGRELSLGASGEDVLRWQQHMRARGFVSLAANGVFGPSSAESCRWLSLYLRMRPTETVGKDLWRATWAAP